MKQLMMAATLVILGACGGEVRPSVHGTAVVEITPAPAPVLTELIVEATNYDAAEYALWLECQDETGAWGQIYLFSLFGDPVIGPTNDFADVFIGPGTCWILLADPYGNLFDSQPVWLAPDSFLDVHYQVSNGLLTRLS